MRTPPAHLYQPRKCRHRPAEFTGAKLGMLSDQIGSPFPLSSRAMAPVSPRAMSSPSSRDAPLSLRAQQINLHQQGPGDCFVATLLAMTEAVPFLSPRAKPPASPWAMSSLSSRARRGNLHQWGPGNCFASRNDRTSCPCRFNQIGKCSKSAARMRLTRPIIYCAVRK